MQYILGTAINMRLIVKQLKIRIKRGGICTQSEAETENSIYRSITHIFELQGMSGK